jgi:hypothetical protein
MTNKQNGHGCGLASVGDALAVVGIIPQSVEGRGVLEAMNISQALSSRATPAGPLLLEAQGQSDLLLVRRLLAKLVRRMAADGRNVSDATQSDAIGAGCVALVQWRAGQVFNDERLASRVAWRAIVSEVSDDTLGDSVPLEAIGDGYMWHDGGHRPGAIHGAMSSAEQVATRRELANYIRAKRGAARRIHSLPGKLDGVRKGRGKRAEAVARVERAAMFLLQGERLDQAATLAGFKASGKGSGSHSAGDAFTQAARRLGFKFHFHARQANGGETVRKAWSHPGEFGNLVVCDEFGAESFAAPVVPVAPYVPPVFAVPTLEDCSHSAHLDAWHIWQTSQPGTGAVPGEMLPLDAHVGAWCLYRLASDERPAFNDWLTSRRVFGAGRSCSFVPQPVEQHVRDWQRAGCPRGRRVVRPVASAKLPVAIRRDGSRLRYRGDSSVAQFVSNALAAVA